jgi:ATP-binding cassette subfamily B protein
MFHRYSFVRQNDQSDCGAAALATVALQHQIPIGIEQLRDLTGTDQRGTNLKGLLHAAEELGFSAKAVQGSYEALPTVPLPAIAHLRTEQGLGHFVVVHRLTRKNVVVADPARQGIEKWSRKEFCGRWTGYLLVLVPEMHRRPQVSEAAGAKPWRRFLCLLTAHRPLLVEAFACALLMTFLGVLTSFYIQHLVDSVLVRQEHRLLHALGIGMALIVLFKTLFAVLRGYLLAHISCKIDLTLVAGYARHLLRLPMRFFEMRRVGEILSRVRDADKVREAISGTTLTAVVDATVVLLTLIVLWIYDWPLALVATAFIPLLLLAVMSHHPAARHRSRESLEQMAQLSAHLVEDVSGVETVKAFGAEQERVEEGEDHLVRLNQTVFALQKINLSLTSLGTVVTGVAGLVILWYGGTRVMDNLLTIGELMFFYSLLNNLMEPLQRLANVNVKLQEALHAVERLHQILDLETESKDARDRLSFTGVRQGVELHEVSFGYGCRGNVLDKVNLRIPAGKKVAIVGESGSGKTTLLKLLLGYYQPTEGRLSIDGQDSRDFDLASLRKGIGLVSQEPFIFNGTIRDNIALGKPGATLAEVVAAARMAGLEGFIASLPERFETVIGERGANLSGGQRQRLAIARALLHRPELLIFDEATSHLDTATERAIQQSLATVFAGRTVVLVAHRLSTVKDADNIYVLHQGRIVEEGTHRQLLARDSWYGRLWRSQTDEPVEATRPELVAVPATPLTRNGYAHA